MGRARLRPSHLRFDPPDLDESIRRHILREHWGVEGRLRSLEGERDQNTRVTTADGRAFVLKTASASEDPAVADLQCAALAHVAQRDPALGVPRVVPSVDGSSVVSVDIDGEVMPTRLLTFLPGTTFDDIALGDGDDGGGDDDAESDDGLHRHGWLGDGALAGVGGFLARLATAFEGFEHPAAGNFMAWSLDSGMVEADQLWDELSDEGRECASAYRERVVAAAGSLEGMRRRVLHNDAHPGNLLRADGDLVGGVIDFGDMADTAVVADLAICAAGFVRGQRDQRSALCSVAGGYHAHSPLLADEVERLADLVLTRIVLGLLLVEFQARHAPVHRRDDLAAELVEYRRSISRWGRLDPRETTDRLFRHLDAVAPVGAS